MVQTFVTCLESTMSGDQNPSMLSKFAGYFGLGMSKCIRLAIVYIKGKYKQY